MMKQEYKVAYLICWVMGVLFIVNTLIWFKTTNYLACIGAVSCVTACIAEGIIGWVLQNDYNEKRGMEEIDRIFDEITKGIQEDEDISV